MTRNAGSPKRRSTTSPPNAGTDAAPFVGTPRGAYACAVALEEASAGISAALPALRLPRDVEQRLADLAGSILGTRFDILDALRNSDTDQAATLAGIARWLRDDLNAYHRAVTDLQALTPRDTDVTRALMLLQGHGFTILEAVAAFRGAPSPGAESRARANISRG